MHRKSTTKKLFLQLLIVFFPAPTVGKSPQNNVVFLSNFNYKCAIFSNAPSRLIVAVYGVEVQGIRRSEYRCLFGNFRNTSCFGRRQCGNEIPRSTHQPQWHQYDPGCLHRQTPASRCGRERGSRGSDKSRIRGEERASGWLDCPVDECLWHVEDTRCSTCNGYFENTVGFAVDSGSNIDNQSMQCFPDALWLHCNWSIDRLIGLVFFYKLLIDCMVIVNFSCGCPRKLLQWCFFMEFHLMDTTRSNLFDWHT